MSRPKTIVVGQGIIGLNLAYQLAKRHNHQVTVIDKLPEAGLGTSKSPAGQVGLSYGILTHPKTLKSLLMKYVQPKQTDDFDYFKLRYRTTLSPEFIRWGMVFVKSCFANDIHDRNQLRNAIRIHSRGVRDTIMSEELIQGFDYQEGSMVVFQSEKGIEAEKATAESFGISYDQCSVEKLMDLEPCISSFRHEIVGGLHYAEDQIGDCRKFTIQLRDVTERKYGVQFINNRSVTKYLKDGEQFNGVQLDNGNVLQSDHIVCATGASINSPEINAHLGNIPIYPLKGYCIEIPLKDEDAAAYPQKLVVHGDLKMWVIRLGNRIRFVSMGEFDGKNFTIHPDIVDSMIHSIEKRYPRIDRSTMSVWVGHRPLSAKDIPLISKRENLLLVSGMGGCGWTFACSVGVIGSDLLVNQKSEAEKHGINMNMMDLDFHRW